MHTFQHPIQLTPCIWIECKWLFSDLSLCWYRSKWSQAQRANIFSQAVRKETKKPEEPESFYFYFWICPLWVSCRVRAYAPNTHTMALHQCVITRLLRIDLCSFSAKHFLHFPLILLAFQRSIFATGSFAFIIRFAHQIIADHTFESKHLPRLVQFAHTHDFIYARF